MYKLSSAGLWESAANNVLFIINKVTKINKKFLIIFSLSFFHYFFAKKSQNFLSFFSFLLTFFPFLFTFLFKFLISFKLPFHKTYKHILVRLIHNFDKNAIIIIHDFWNRECYHIVLDFLEFVDRVETLGVFKPKNRFDKARMKNLLKEYEFVVDWLKFYGDTMQK